MAWEGLSQPSQVTNSMVHEGAPMVASTKTVRMEKAYLKYLGGKNGKHLVNIGCEQ